MSQSALTPIHAALLLVAGIGIGFLLRSWFGPESDPYESECACPPGSLCRRSALRENSAVPLHERRCMFASGPSDDVDSEGGLTDVSAGAKQMRRPA